MAKRLTDTSKWDKIWFRQLPPEYKCFWQYILDRCNSAGVWEVDFETASYYIGKELIEDEAKEILKNQIIIINNNKQWFIVDFIEFQYKCTIDQLNPTNNAHKPVITIIEKYQLQGVVRGLSGGTQPTLGGAMYMYKDMDMDLDKEKKVKEKEKATEENVKVWFKENHWEEKAAIIFFNYYESQDWMTGGGSPRRITNWQAKAKECMTTPAKYKWLMGMEDQFYKNTPYLKTDQKPEGITIELRT